MAASKIAGGVAFLQQSGQHAAQPRRNLLHGERRAHAPFPAHADAEERAQHQEGSVIGRQASGHFAGGIKDQVDHQRKAAAVAVGQQSEKNAPTGRKANVAVMESAMAESDL